MISAAVRSSVRSASDGGCVRSGVCAAVRIHCRYTLRQFGGPFRTVMCGLSLLSHLHRGVGRRDVPAARISCLSFARIGVRL